jgi:hypothetical protein
VPWHGRPFHCAFAVPPGAGGMRRKSVGPPSPGPGSVPEGPWDGVAGRLLGPPGLGLGDGVWVGKGTGTSVGGTTGSRRRSSDVGGFEKTRPRTRRTARATSPAAGAGRRRTQARSR